jgi:hypothetical protein
MKFSQEPRLPPRVTQAIRAFAGNRTNSDPVCVTSLMRTTRYAAPELDMTDNDLSRLIVDVLIKSRCTIDFGSLNTEPEIHITR